MLDEKGLNKIPKINFMKTQKSDANRNYYLEVLDFFVVNSPLPEASTKGKKFKDLGIKGQIKTKLLRVIKKKINVSIYNIDIKNEDKLIQNVKKAFKSKESTIILINDSNQFDSIFRGIRNSLAHGNYYSINDVYYFFNINRKRIKFIAKISNIHLEMLKNITMKHKKYLK